MKGATCPRSSASRIAAWCEGGAPRARARVSRAVRRVEGASKADVMALPPRSRELTRSCRKGASWLHDSSTGPAAVVGTEGRVRAAEARVQKPGSPLS